MSKSNIVFAGLAPHAPILIPGVGGQDREAALSTTASLSEWAHRVLGTEPETLVVLSPHTPRRSGALGLWRSSWLRGSFARFGSFDEGVELPLDAVLADEIEREGRRRGLRFWHVHEVSLDHGALVPLWYLASAGWNGPVVVVGLSDLGAEEDRLLGQALAAASISTGRRFAVLASGDMSHRLKPTAPCGFDPRARNFDKTFVELLRGRDYERLGRIDRDLRELAAEDVVDSSLVAVAACCGDFRGSEVLSYEGPFGVGYCVAVFLSRAASSEEKGCSEEPGSKLSDLPALARRAINEYFSGRKVPPEGLKASGALGEQGCVFVTLHQKKDGALRGCIGTLRPQEPNLARETWINALSAAFQDPRFKSLRREELDDTHISVTILGAMEPVRGLGELDPSAFGVVVSSEDGRRGVLLPGIAGVDTAMQQVSIARRKAGIAPDEAVRLERFRAYSYEEAPTGAAP